MKLTCLRPGEKISEELYSEYETISSTTHNKIFYVSNNSNFELFDSKK